MKIAKADWMLIDERALRFPDGADYTDPYYVLQFWQRRSDGEQDYFTQWSEVVRGASGVFGVMELAHQRAAEEGGEVTFAVYVVAPDECEECSCVDLVRLYGQAPDGPIEVQETFGWTMYVEPAEAQELGLPIADDPREARLLRAQMRGGER